MFRSTFGGQWKVRTRRTPVCWSTSAGTWTARPGSIHRSRRSTSSPVERWSWSSSWPVPGMWSPSACGRQCPGTWSIRQTAPCWRRGPYGCRRHTSWWSCMWSRAGRTTPCQGTTAGTSPPDSGTARCQSLSPTAQIHQDNIIISLPSFISDSQLARAQDEDHRRDEWQCWRRPKSYSVTNFWKAKNDTEWYYRGQRTVEGVGSSIYDWKQLDDEDLNDTKVRCNHTKKTATQDSIEQRKIKTNTSTGKYQAIQSTCAYSWHKQIKQKSQCTAVS